MRWNMRDAFVHLPDEPNFKDASGVTELGRREYSGRLQLLRQAGDAGLNESAKRLAKVVRSGGISGSVAEVRAGPGSDSGRIAEETSRASHMIGFLPLSAPKVRICPSGNPQ